jgi:hypothetical protein
MLGMHVKPHPAFTPDGVFQHDNDAAQETGPRISS